MTSVNENIQKLVHLHTVGRKIYGASPKLKIDYHMMIQTFYYWVFIQNIGNQDFERIFALSRLLQHNSQKKIRKHLKSLSTNKWMKKHDIHLHVYLPIPTSIFIPWTVKHKKGSLLLKTPWMDLKDIMLKKYISYKRTNTT